MVRYSNMTWWRAIRLSLEFVPLVFSWYDKGYGRVLGVLAKFMVMELGFF
jgi:hypothetical protein